MNNPQGIRISTALTHLQPARHRLNLTIRPHMLARRILFEAAGCGGGGREQRRGLDRRGQRHYPQCWWPKSPHLLLLSGVGPTEALRRMGMPLVHDLPGVGQNLRNHPIASVSMRVKEGVTLSRITRAPGLPCAVAASGSSTRNDMMIMVNAIYSPLSGDVLPERTMRFSGALKNTCQRWDPGAVRRRSAPAAALQLQPPGRPMDRQRLREAIRCAATGNATGLSGYSGGAGRAYGPGAGLRQRPGYLDAQDRRHGPPHLRHV